MARNATNCGIIGSARRPSGGSGFTLIELLVAIAIFTTLSSFLVVSYSRDEKSRSLRQQAQIAVAGLEQAQNMALAGEDVAGQTPAGYAFAIAACQQDCSFRLLALMSDGTAESISQVELRAAVSQDLQVAFLPPRGRMKILPDDRETAKLEIKNSSGSYCLRLNAVSGRIDLAAGACD